MIIGQIITLRHDIQMDEGGELIKQGRKLKIDFVDDEGISGRWTHNQSAHSMPYDFLAEYFEIGPKWLKPFVPYYDPPPKNELEDLIF